MYYILHKPYGSTEPWIEMPAGFRNQKSARYVVWSLVRKKNEDGSRLFNVRLCIGKGRDRRDLVVF